MGSISASTEEAMVSTNKGIRSASGASISPFESISKSFSHRNGEPTKKEEERQIILNSKILTLFVLSSPLNIAVTDVANMGIFDVPMQFLPSFLSAKRSFHSSALLIIKYPNSSQKDAIIIEYGMYCGDIDEQNTNYITENKKGCVHYWKNDGMRFFLIDGKAFSNVIFDRTKFDYHKGYRIGTVKVLENQYQLTVKQLIEKCWEDEDWNSSDYFLSKHNCQHFVAKIIKVTNAQRFGNGIRKSHNISLVHFPPPIIDSFENNEKENIIFGRLPLIGPIIDNVHWHILKDMNEDEKEEEIKIKNAVSGVLDFY